MHRRLLKERIERYARIHADEEDTVARFLDFIDTNPRCFERDNWVGHITGSAWLVNAAHTHVLLTHHRKLEKWLQLGGHSDGDPETLTVALREASEESGLAVTPLLDEIFDLDVHEIPARELEPAHYHFDVRFLLCVQGNEAFAVSEESLDLAWVPINGLATYSVDESILRMYRKWRYDG